MASRLLLSVLLAACMFSTLEARLLQADGPARNLLFNSCPLGCGPNDGDGTGVCAFDSTYGSYTCSKCVPGLYVLSDGRCGCPAGKYVNNPWSCDDCPKGSYCSGGPYVDAATTYKSDCSSFTGGVLGWTTLGLRSTSYKACVNMPGYYYTDSGGGVITATACDANFYSPGYKKQKACVPCPSGFMTAATKSTAATDCYVKPGYFLKSPGQAAPCPNGEYQDTTSTDHTVAPSQCKKCDTGVNTLNVASTAPAQCALAKPGYYPTSVGNANGLAVTVCPYKSYCAGSGSSTVLGSDITGNGAITGNVYGPVACLYGTWTKTNGASTAAECMTPPGFGTSMTVPSGGSTTQCGTNPGQYRAQWVPAGNNPCDSCGAGLLSDPTAQADDVVSDGATTYQVATSSGSCYVKKGWGVYYNAANQKFSAVACAQDKYGAAERTYGLTANPCRSCPLNMVTHGTDPVLNYWDTTDLGYFDVRACVTQAGYGYNGRASYKCPVGTYNAAWTLQGCSPCTAGLTTDPAVYASSSNDCAAGPGVGVSGGVLQQCPVGTYAVGYRASNAPCSLCVDVGGTGLSLGLTTSQAGTQTQAECNVCKGGYGGQAAQPGARCTTTCGGAGTPTYGLEGSLPSAGCTACPPMTTGFSFDYQGTALNFTPSVVARQYADSAGDCLAEFGQLDDIAWDLPSALEADGAATDLATCVLHCHTSSACMFLRFTYSSASAGTCKLVKNTGGTPSGTDIIALKALSYADTSVSSVHNKTATSAPRKMAKAPSTKLKAKAVGMGSYTFWQNVTISDYFATAIPQGTAGLQTGVAVTVPVCLAACDADVKCAGVGMIGDTAATLTSCQKIYGDGTLNKWIRGMIKVDVTRLTLA